MEMALSSAKKKREEVNAMMRNLPGPVPCSPVSFQMQPVTGRDYRQEIRKRRELLHRDLNAIATQRDSPAANTANGATGGALGDQAQHLRERLASVKRGIEVQLGARGSRGLTYT